MRDRLCVLGLNVPRSKPASRPLLLGPAVDGDIQVLLGAASPEDQRVDVVILSERGWNALQAFGVPSGWSALDRDRQRQVAALLAQEGARPGEIARWLGAPASARAEVWRWIALERRACPELRTAVEEGRLTLGHTRYLLGLPAEQQKVWTKACVRGGWSVHRLRAELRGGVTPGAPQASPDVAELERRLSAALGAAVGVDWPDDPRSRRQVTIDWFDVESLKGIFAKLAAGPEMAPQPAARRRLVIEVQSADELAALTDHLLAE